MRNKLRVNVACQLLALFISSPSEKTAQSSVLLKSRTVQIYLTLLFGYTIRQSAAKHTEGGLITVLYHRENLTYFLLSPTLTLPQHGIFVIALPPLPQEVKNTLEYVLAKETVHVQYEA